MAVVVERETSWRGTRGNSRWGGGTGGGSSWSNGCVWRVDVCVGGLEGGRRGEGGGSRVGGAHECMSGRIKREGGHLCDVTSKETCTAAVYNGML